MSTIGIILTFAFANNFVLVQLLGLCPAIGASRSVGSAAGMGFALVFAMSLAALAAWAIQRLVLAPLGLEALQTIAFVAAAAALVRLAGLVARRACPPLYRALGAHLPLLAANCAVLGIALLAARADFGALESLTAGFAAGAGMLLALLALAWLRERLEAEWVPRPLQGIPITLITAGLMALALLALDRALLR